MGVLLTTTQSLSALARFHPNNWEKNSNSHCFESLCIVLVFFNACEGGLVRMKSCELTCVLVCFYWGEWKGEQLAVAWGLRIVHHIGDSHVGGKQCGDTALRNKGGFV